MKLLLMIMNLCFSSAALFLLGIKQMIKTWKSPLAPFVTSKAMFLPENKQLQQRGPLQLCERFMPGTVSVCFKEEVPIEVGC